MTVSHAPVALVTGGSRGIGFGVARELAVSGFALAINGRRPADDVAAALDELRSVGVEAEYFAADVGRLDDHGPLVEAIRERFRRLDVLVNNAGVAPEVRADLLEAEPASFDRLVTINLRGPYFLTQRVARWMIEQRAEDASRRPAVVNVSSISAAVASTNRGDYCISKAGVAMATRLWAARLAEFGIGVYEVRPGVIRTDMTAAVTEKYDRLIAEGLTVEPRWGEPADVGRAVAMLCRGELTYATGAVLVVDGGLTLPRL
ncbi:MAG: 3-ketoacyl-ACP reductase [Pirellulales bacterium]|nr:3-ketoacyl-ACP reductase [Pirellulales bacterium]